jgi:putative transposase
MLKDAMARHGKPDIFNTDQGSQFTGSALTGVLATNGIAIVKGHCLSSSGST